MIDSSNPLLAIAIDCLHYAADERPSASELCQQIAQLKKDNSYSASQLQSQHETDHKLLTDKEQQAHELYQQCKKQEEIIQDLEERNDELQSQHETDHKCLADKEQQVHELHQQCKKQEQIIWDLEERNNELQRRLEDIKTSPPDPSASVVLNWREVDLSSKQEEIIKDLQERNDELQRRLEDILISPPDPSASVVLNWREVEPSSRPRFNMIRGAAVVDGSIAYLMNASGEICSYNSITNTWNDLPACPLFGSSLAVVNDLVTAVGGEEKTSKILTTTLITLETKDGEISWMTKKQYHPIPTPRSFAAVVCTRNSLIVAGGKKGRQYGQTYVNTVEIMDTENGTWCSAARLPYPYSRMSATVCKDRIYMLGGFGITGRVRSVVTCSIDALLQSQTWSYWIKSGLTFKPVWSLAAKLPRYHLATAVSINDQLLALGGSSKHEKECTKCIHKYNVNRNSWEYVSDMPRSVQRCLAVVLPNNELIVVGGGVNSEDDQEAII